MRRYPLPARAVPSRPAMLLSAALATTAAFAVLPSGAAGQVQGPPAPGAEGAPKIGVIDVDRLAAESPAGQALQQRMQTYAEEIQAELQTRQESVRQLEERVGAAPDTMPAEERRALERRLQDAITEFQRYQQDRQEEVTAMQAEGQERIRAEISPVVDEVQAEYGYDLVLNAAYPVIIIFSDRVDITQLVLDRLQPEGSP